MLSICLYWNLLWLLFFEGNMKPRTKVITLLEADALADLHALFSKNEENTLPNDIQNSYMEYFYVLCGRFFWFDQLLSSYIPFVNEAKCNIYKDLYRITSYYLLYSILWIFQISMPKENVLQKLELIKYFRILNWRKAIWHVLHFQQLQNGFMQVTTKSKFKAI